MSREPEPAYQPGTPGRRWDRRRGWDRWHSYEEDGEGLGGVLFFVWAAIATVGLVVWFIKVVTLVG